MPTSVSQLTQIISQATGLPIARTKQVARRLLEDGHLPRSAGSYVASIGSIHAVMLLLGALADSDIHDASRAMGALFDLRANDTGRTVGHQMHELLTTLHMLDDGVATVLDGEIIVDAAAPLVVFRLNVSGDPIESVHAPDGVDVDKARAETVRKQIVLPTLALGRIAQALRRNAKAAA